jgi:hypothetical protein
MKTWISICNIKISIYLCTLPSVSNLWEIFGFQISLELNFIWRFHNYPSTWHVLIQILSNIEMTKVIYLHMSLNPKILVWENHRNEFHVFSFNHNQLSFELFVKYLNLIWSYPRLYNAMSDTKEFKWYFSQIWNPSCYSTFPIEKWVWKYIMSVWKFLKFKIFILN